MLRWVSTRSFNQCIFSKKDRWRGRILRDQWKYVDRVNAVRGTLLCPAQFVNSVKNETSLTALHTFAQCS